MPVFTGMMSVFLDGSCLVIWCSCRGQIYCHLV